MIRNSQLLALLLVPTLSASSQEFRDTAVPNSQIAAVVRDVAQWHDMQHPDCLFSKPVGSKLIERTQDGSVEHWTITACSGRNFTYEVTVLDSQGGSVTNMVSNVDGEPIASDQSGASEPDAAECADMQRQFDDFKADSSSDKDYSAMAELAAKLAVCNASQAAP